MYNPPLALEFSSQYTAKRPRFERSAHYFTCYCLMTVVVIWLLQHCDDCIHPLAPNG
jgi:hypothetical protein